MLSVIMLSVIMTSAIMLNVIMLSVVAPLRVPQFKGRFLFPSSNITLGYNCCIGASFLELGASFLSGPVRASVKEVKGLTPDLQIWMAR
jgi:hypothetical protein